MFYNGSNLYFATIRKVTAGFIGLFTNLEVSQYSGNGGAGTKVKTIKVPLKYGPSHKWLALQQEYSRAGDTVRLQTLLPRCSVEMKSIKPEPSRKLQTTSFNTNWIKDSNDLATFFKQLQPVPYSLDFEVTLTTKKIDDALQLIEQIVPNFTPAYNIKIVDIPQLEISKDIPIILKDINFEDNWNGDPNETRYIITTISFTALINMYPQIKDSEPIRQVIAKIENENRTLEATITTSVDPIDSNPDDDWEAVVDIEE